MKFNNFRDSFQFTFCGNTYAIAWCKFCFCLEFSNVFFSIKIQQFLIYFFLSSIFLDCQHIQSSTNVQCECFSNGVAPVTNIVWTKCSQNVRSENHLALLLLLVRFVAIFRTRWNVHYHLFFGTVIWLLVSSLEELFVVLLRASWWPTAVVGFVVGRPTAVVGWLSFVSVLVHFLWIFDFFFEN